MAKLTPKQQAFCDYYIELGNATEAARRAGYSERTADRIAHENLRKLEIVKYIEERNVQLESSRIADMKEVKEFWSSVLRDGEADTKDRLKASEYIAKTNAAFVEKVQHSGEMNHQMNVQHDLSKLSMEELKQLEQIVAKTAETE